MSLKDVIDEKLVDLNAYDDITDEFYDEVTGLYSRYRNNSAEIRTLENSLLHLTLACPKSRSLSVELIDFIETVTNEFMEREQIIELTEQLLVKTPHKEDSPITGFLTSSVHNDNWYGAYIFDSAFSTEEEKAEFFKSILYAISEGRISTSEESLKKLIRKFIKSGMTISYETMLTLLTAGVHHQNYIHDAMLEIGFHKPKFDFNLEDAFTEAFRLLGNEEGTVVLDERTEKRLLGLFKYACSLQGITFASLIFTDWIISQPERDKIIDIITHWLSEYPYLLDVFNETFLKEEEVLEEGRALTMQPTTENRQS